MALDDQDLEPLWNHNYKQAVGTHCMGEAEAVQNQRNSSSKFDSDFQGLHTPLNEQICDLTLI